MAQGVDGDPGGEVEVGVAVGVPEGGALSPDEDDVGAGVGLEDVAVVGLGGGVWWKEEDEKKRKKKKKG